MFQQIWYTRVYLFAHTFSRTSHIHPYDSNPFGRRTPLGTARHLPPSSVLPVIQSMASWTYRPGATLRGRRTCLLTVDRLQYFTALSIHESHIRPCPKSVPSADVLTAISCKGVLDVPGCEHASLFVLSGMFPSEAEADWFNRDNVVLTVTSRTTFADTSKELDTVAVAAALDTCRMNRSKPPALTW